MDTTEAQIKTLEKELAKLKRQQNKPPEPLLVPDFSKLRQLVIGITNTLACGEQDDDSKHYIYEAACEAVYGDKYWSWANKRFR